MSILAGELDRKITFQSFTVTGKSSLNEPVKSWANLATTPSVRAQVLPLAQREMVDAGHIMTTNDKAFIVRYRGDITPLMRIVFESKNYDIHSVTEIGRREGLRIVARLVE